MVTNKFEIIAGNKLIQAPLLFFFAMTCDGFPADPDSTRHYYDAATVAEARGKVAEHDWAQRRQERMKERVAWVLEMSDRELWDFVPPVTQRRALNVAFNVGCPEHGTEVLREGGPYPWIMSRDRPFKVECPVGGEIYPSNDFVPWHHGGMEGEIDTTEKYVDDGTGYVGPDGQVYHFVAHYIFWQRWRGEIVPALRDLRDLYLLTDDKRYARPVAILLARIASDYPDSDYARQAVHRQNPPHDIRGGILDYIWENGAIVSPGATAFDAIAPALDDAEVVGFIRGKGIDDVRLHIEENLLFELVNRITGGREGEYENRIWGNFGMYQRSMAILAVVLDNDDPERGLTSDEMVGWIMRPGPWDEVGAIREALWNRFYRDGHGGEASPAYSAGWANSVSSVAQVLAKRGYDLYEHPKMRRLVDVWLDMAVLGKWTPSIGDTGDIFGSERLGWYRNILLPAYRAAGDKRWAKALEMTNVADNDLWERVPIEQIHDDAAAFGEWPSGGTRLLGGYGLAIAESPSTPVGLALYYGYAGGGHGHRDRLNIEMFALDRPVLPQHGYPTPLGSIEEAPKRFYWTGNTIAQYAVTVNRKWQQTLDRGRLNRLASTPGIQFIDASADDAYPEMTSLYRRTSLLIENPQAQPYLFDIFRVAGGWEHVWSFHGPPFEEFETFGLDLGEVREEGTLAGEHIAFGEEPDDPKTDPTSGFQFLFNVRKAPPPDAAWGATWSQPDEDAHLRMTALPSAVTEVVLADCEPQLKPNHPDTMPYLLAFNGDGDPEGPNNTRSDFAAVVEPYEKEPALGKIKRLATSGADHAVAASIRHTNGADVIISHRFADDRSDVRLRGDSGDSATLEGELAHLAIGHDEEALRGSLVNVRHLKTPWLDVETAGELNGEITSVDYTENRIVLDRRIESAGALVGQTVVVGNERHGTAFQIHAVNEVNGRTALHFGEMPMLVAMGQVESINDSALTTRTEFGQWQADGGKHAGRRLLDARRNEEFLIEKIEGQTIFLGDGETPLNRLFSTKEEDETNEFWIAETGAGDEWRVPGIFWLTKNTDEGISGPHYEVGLNSPARARLKVPEGLGDSWVYRDAAGEWRELPVSRHDERLYFELSPESLVNGKTTIQPGN